MKNQNLEELGRMDEMAGLSRSEDLGAAEESELRTWFLEHGMPEWELRAPGERAQSPQAARASLPGCVRAT